MRRLRNFAATGLAGVLLIAPTGNAAGRSREIAQSRPTGTPIMAIIAIKQQRVTIYDADGRILQAPVSTGRTGYETPAGIYSVIQKEAEHYSNLYDDASMPFMHRITWSGIALHAGPLPGYPASHGCIRMPYNFAQSLFGQTKIGMRVIVAPKDVAPVEIAHVRLFKPKTVEVDLASSGVVGPKHIQALKAVADAKTAAVAAAARKAEEARQAAIAAGSQSARFVRAIRVAEREKFPTEVKLKDAEHAEDVYATSSTPNEKADDLKASAANRLAEAQMRLDAVKSDGQAKMDAATSAHEAASLAEAARVAAVDAAREANAKLAPVSVFISRQTQQLYVRQAFQPIFDTPVAISGPTIPLGTHVYTALRYVDEGTSLQWNTVSMTKSGRPGEERSKGRRHQRSEGEAHTVGTDAGAALAALDRITIPQEAIDRISEVISPGSVLIVSDEPMSSETGKGTDFVVLMSGEPLGGIKIRQRKPDRFDDYSRRYRRYHRSPSSGGASSWW
jgi:L,D-transpeptidase catalytic domain